MFGQSSCGFLQYVYYDQGLKSNVTAVSVPSFLPLPGDHDVLTVLCVSQLLFDPRHPGRLRCSGDATTEPVAT